MIEVRAGAIRTDWGCDWNRSCGAVVVENRARGQGEAYPPGIIGSRHAVRSSEHIFANNMTTTAASFARRTSRRSELGPDRNSKIFRSASPSLVFALVPDPVGAGFVDSLARPGGNATGFMAFEYRLSGKWVEMLKQIAPSVTRVAVIREPAIAAGAAQFGIIQSVVPSLGMALRMAV